MAGKTAAERRAEMLGDGANAGSIKRILGQAARDEAEEYLQHHDYVVNLHLHIGKLGRGKSPEAKQARQAIRVAMLVAWMSYPDAAGVKRVEHATQMLEMFEDSRAADIESQVRHMWANKDRANNAVANDNVSDKQRLLNQHPQEFFRRFSLGPVGELPAPGDHELNFEHQAIDDGARIATMKVYTQAGFVTPRLRLMAHQAPAPPPANAGAYNFLPWKQNRITELRIPARPPNVNAAGQPTIFFTAFLKGCSVFIQWLRNEAGHRDHISVFHCGIGVNLRDVNHNYLPDVGGFKAQAITAKTNNDAATFWRVLFKALVRQNLPAQYHNNINGVAEVSKNDYSDTERVRIFKTRMLKAMKRRDATKQQLRAVVAEGIGSVIGLRDDQDWTFYLQENVCFRYTDSANNNIMTTIPIRLSQFFPFPRILVWDGLTQMLPDVITDTDLYIGLP